MTTRPNVLPPTPQGIQSAAQALRAGLLVAFPTETVYGLGAHALDAEAVQGIFIAKKRPANDPLIVHIHDLSQLDALVSQIPAVVPLLAARFWAGALTLVMKKSEAVPDVVSAGLDTVAVRMPAHPIALDLLRAADVPVAAPSANLFSRPSPTHHDHVLQDLQGRIDYLIAGGATPIGLESTVLDLTGIPTILRPGAITREMLLDILPRVDVRQAHLKDDQNPTAPGMLEKHYSPDADLILVVGKNRRDALYDLAQQQIATGKRVGLMILAEDVERFAGLDCQQMILGQGGNLAEVAKNLFAAIRFLDQQSVDVILVAHVEDTPSGMGTAILDRLTRAAEGHLIEAN